MRIYLIGMPGSGKTTIGEKLAKKLNYQFVDLDAEISQQQQMTIHQIFLKSGEAEFRKLETQALQNLGNNIVVACGGGIVLNRKHKEMMNGLIVLINVTIESIAKRIQSQAERPLLKTNSLMELYKQRESLYYDFADLIVSNEQGLNQTVTKLYKEIQMRLK